MRDSFVDYVLSRPPILAKWEDEDRANYDVESMRSEFRDRLYRKDIGDKSTIVSRYTAEDRNLFTS